MEFWQGLMIITSLHLLAAASPGPDFILVSQQTLTQGRRTGLLCSLGITLGLGIHILYSVLGLATIIAHSQPLLTLIKYLGGAYLIYLGWQGIQAKPKKPLTNTQTTTQKSPQNQSVITTIRRGFLCNVFNPKAPIYFVTVFSLVLTPDLPTWQLATYGIWMMVLQMAWFSTVVFLLSMPTINQRFQQSAHWIDRVLGGVMIAFGLNLLINND